MTTKLIAITNCLDCPYHKTVSDPGSDDSFDASDESVLCTKTPGQGSKTRNNDEKYRIISACERWPKRQRKECEIPEWCPLGGITRNGQV